MMKQIELLAPGGDIHCIKAAVLAKANAIYCGLNKFNARNRAENLSFDDLQGVLHLAHKNDCKVFLTLNIILIDNEFSSLFTLLNKLVNTSIDGVIVQDIGLFYLISSYFPTLNIHASTQVTTHNSGQIEFLKRLNVDRINLSRELNIKEIGFLSGVAHKNNMFTEVFVHGSNCISFSGICYMSSFRGGSSGNRGKCSQPCRNKFFNTSMGIDYPLNLKDNSAFFDLPKLAAAGVDSLKIEGRIKKFDYVFTVVKTWSKQLHLWYNNKKLSSNNIDLYKVFNRDFSNAFLSGKIGKDMFINNPRNNSVAHLKSLRNIRDESELYAEFENSKELIKRQMESLSIEKAPVKIFLKGEEGSVLTFLIVTPDEEFIINSNRKLVASSSEILAYDTLFKSLKGINETEFFIEEINFDNLLGDVFIPFSELTIIKHKILFSLNNRREFIAPVELPKVAKPKGKEMEPTLSVLISEECDLYLCNDTNAKIYFELPSNLVGREQVFIDIFINNNVSPWFPSILIGDDYIAAVNILKNLIHMPIVTNNTGIAFEAFKLDVHWIAGPYLNIANSYSLQALKSQFNCRGAFISNEISKRQMGYIKAPDSFNLYYSIYHPILLMTSRQCFFHQVTGCNKSVMDEGCILDCAKRAKIINLDNTSYFIEKSRGSFNVIYNEFNNFNTQVISDFPNKFTSLFVDLRNVETLTKISLKKQKIVHLFQRYFQGSASSKEQLIENIKFTTNKQYNKGI